MLSWQGLMPVFTVQQLFLSVVQAVPAALDEWALDSASMELVRWATAMVELLPAPWLGQELSDAMSRELFLRSMYPLLRVLDTLERKHPEAVSTIKLQLAP